MEALEVTNEPIDQGGPAFLSEVIPEGKRSGRGAVTEWIRVGTPSGVVPSEPVRDGVDKIKVLREGTGSDLIIVIRVTPSTEVFVEDRRIGEAGAGICEVGYQHGRKPTVPQTRRLTQGPVPVRVSSLIATFFLQRKFEIIQIATMPRQEETGEMDLRGGNVRMSPLIDTTFSRSAKKFDQGHLPTDSNPCGRKRSLMVRDQ